MSGTMEEQVAFLSERVMTLERRLTTLQEMGTALGESLNLDDVLQTITLQVTNLLDADRATLYVVDEKERKLRSHVTVGGRVEEIVLELGEGIAGWTARAGKGVNLKDVYRDQRFNAHVDKLTGYRTRSMLCQPMRTPRGRIVGVAQVINKRGEGYFTVEDEHLLTSMTTQAAIALENAKLFSDVLKTNIQLRDAQDRLQRNYERLELLYRIETEVTSTMDPDNLLERILTLCTESVTSEVGALLIRHATGGDLYHLERGGTVRKLENASVGGVMGRSCGPGWSRPWVAPTRRHRCVPCIRSWAWSSGWPSASRCPAPRGSPWGSSRWPTPSAGARTSPRTIGSSSPSSPARWGAR